MTSEDPYVYPGTNVLINKLGLTTGTALAYSERQLVTQRMAEAIPEGRFDLSHLKAIHRHLFQDVYAWAGETRTVEIAKGSSQFMFTRFIEGGMKDVHRRIEQRNFLRGLSRDEFAAAAGEIIGDVNHVHPFREGNGRTQLQYLKQLAGQAGYEIALRKLHPLRWIEASQEANRGEYGLMTSQIRLTLAGRDRGHGR